MADVAGTAPHQQTTLDDIARRIARMEANLIDLFEHVGLTPRRPPTPRLPPTPLQLQDKQPGTFP
ncbi:UNVERIFIED_CONTAM: hypothetical protein Sangu_3227600 [Sesamum angustifolium]|uniref:Uncharacterized protein n=1 Tax=Sesamum angustifolium TaxID=2727405 RepID=A0AAW2JHX9_9LAMI